MNIRNNTSNHFFVKKKALLFFFFIVSLFLQSNQLFSQFSNKLDGITMVAPPKAIGEAPLNNISDMNAEWVCLVPYGFVRKGKTEVQYNLERQWWGEREQGVRESIRLAKQAGLMVMLKPQIYIPGGWVGELTFDNEKDWQSWEVSFKAFTLFWLKIAEEEDVELFCIGTEYKLFAQEREKFWRSLIDEAYNQYCGMITYSSNWDGFEKIPFWDALDYIGVSTYFPLSEEKTPSVDALIKKWEPIYDDFKAFSKKIKKPILFTEYGYLSVDGCAGKTWELEKVVKSTPINEQAQANAIEAILSTFGEAEFWAGGFLWKWFPDGMGHEGYPKRDYTVQQKIGQSTLKKHYQKL